MMIVSVVTELHPMVSKILRRGDEILMQSHRMFKVISLSLIALCFVLIFGCSRNVNQPVASLSWNIPEGELDSSEWGKYFPHQYSSYKKNLEVTDEDKANYGSSERKSHLAHYPWKQTIWAGYGFSKDYNEDRGHVWSVTDLISTQRVNEDTPGSCLTCKTPNVPVLYEKMGDDYYATPLSEHLEDPNSMAPIGCANCHDNETMELKIVQPPLRDALKKLGKDPDNLSHQEKRTLVCAQCHVEYYFDKDNKKRVTFPWTEGFEPADIERYYDKFQFVDWSHAKTDQGMLKTQHPEFETFQDSAHEEAGVSCADCHMPYMKAGNEKYSSHWWTSPLKTAEQSCGTCHKDGAESRRERVKYIQDKVADQLHKAGRLSEELILSIEAAEKIAGIDTVKLEEAKKFSRRAVWYWDFVAAENSMGFHNPEKALHSLADSIDYSRQGISLVKEAVAKVGGSVSIQPAKGEDANPTREITQKPKI